MTSYMHPVLNDIKGLNLTINQEFSGGPLLEERVEWPPIRMYDYIEQDERLNIVTTVDSQGETLRDLSVFHCVFVCVCVGECVCVGACL